MISIKIKDPLFTFKTRLVNILDFNPKKLSIQKVCAISDEIESIYYVKYDEDPFNLVIDDLKGYFKYSEEKELKFIIEDQSKRKIYDQIWDWIKEFINNVYCVGFRFYDYSRDCNVIRFDTDDSLQLEYNRIDISEGIDIKKCKETSRECNLCKFYYFLDKNFNYGPYL